ncbi:MAG TPA: YciI family protein [Gammaproteobacteria bacterium]|nr:YciI family protein [Gammaproteobacteria bacterium]
MLYAILAEDVTESASLRAAARPAHLDRLDDLMHAGRLVLSGPHPAIDSIEPGPAGYTGSLIVAEFESLLAAREWAEADPFVAAGVYASVVVKPFVKILP